MYDKMIYKYIYMNGMEKGIEEANIMLLVVCANETKNSKKSNQRMENKWKFDVNLVFLLYLEKYDMPNAYEYWIILTSTKHHILFFLHKNIAMLV